MKKSYFYIFLISFLLLFIVEILSRAINWSIENDSIKNYSVEYEYSDRTIGDVKPNQNSHENSYFGRPFHIVINDQGFRTK